MTADEFARRVFEDVWNQGRFEVAEEIFADDIKGYSPVGDPVGREALTNVIRTFRQAFPDIRFTTQEIVSDGDLVAVRWTCRGTHQGELMGLAPTGREIDLRGMGLWRLEDGRAVEGWQHFDRLSLLEQLGAASTPTAAAAS